MAGINFNTSNQTYRQIMGNGLTYKVPRFQRDYSWTEEQWDDLWLDIQNVLQGEEPAHYMGYLVLQSRDNKKFDVIDGQQRLTTLSILVLAILKGLELLIKDDIDSENNTRRQDQLRNSYIGFLDPVTLVPKSKLTLNRNNDVFFQNYLIPLQRLPLRNLKPSEHQMRKAFNWFLDKISKNYLPKRDGATLAEFLDSLSDKLFFTVITVDDEINAYKVFETLNARGVKLSSTDLLKNYLFSVVDRDQPGDEHLLKSLEDRWELLVGKLGSESFPEFLRAHWNSRNKLVRSSDLFKTIRARLLNQGQVFSLVRDMEVDADVYAALFRPEDEIWGSRTELKEALSILNLFGAKQIAVLLLTGYRRLNIDDFTKLVKGAVVLMLRYNVIGGLPANEQESVFNNGAVRLHQEQNPSLLLTFQMLKTIYPSDAAFEEAFADKQLRTTNGRNKKIARYLLFHIEKYLTGRDFDVDSAQYNLEHILPENPGIEWEAIDHSDQEQFIYRLGNMTLMKSNENRNIGNQGFEVKKDMYKNSEFEITRKIAEDNTDWTPSRIAGRQRWMAKQAKSIWKISQLG